MISYLTQETDKVFKGWVKRITKRGELEYSYKFYDAEYIICYDACLTGRWPWTIYYVDYSGTHSLGQMVLPQNAKALCESLARQELK